MLHAYAQNLVCSETKSKVRPKTILCAGVGSLGYGKQKFSLVLAQNCLTSA